MVTDKNIIELIENELLRGKEVYVTLSNDGRNHLVQKDNITYFKVSSKEIIDVADEKIEEISRKKEMQKNEEDKKDFEIEEMLGEKRSQVAEERKDVPKRRITKNVRDARTENIERYKNTVIENQKDEIEPISNNKKSIKSKAITKVGKFFGAVTLAAIMAFTVPTIVEEIRTKIEEQDKENEQKFQESLKILKEKIAESINVNPESIKIYNYSTPLTSVSYQTRYIVKIGSEQYEYYYYFNDGSVIETDTIRNKELREAIRVITEADGGNRWKCEKAFEMAEAIKNGEVDVSMENAVNVKKQTQNNKANVNIQKVANAQKPVRYMDDFSR